jgi:homoserine kinase type II
MAVYTHIGAEDMAAIVARFGVGRLVSAKGIAEGVENSNYLIETQAETGQARFILTVYEKRVDVSDLPFFLALLDHLADRGCPVPRTMHDARGAALQNWQGKSLALIEFLPGLSVSRPTADIAAAVGQALGHMHGAVADFGMNRPNSLGLDGWHNLAAQCGTALDDIHPGLYRRVSDELNYLAAHWPNDLPQSVIHADLFPDNVLITGDAVSGMIDFYFACTDIRAYDVAVTHAAWSFDTSGKNYNASVGDALLNGYRTSFGLSEAEEAAFPILARGACLRFLLTRAWDWLNTPPTALVTRKDPIAFLRRLDHYAALKSAL